MVRVLEWAGKDRHSVDGPATGTGIFTSIAGSDARFGTLRGHKSEYAPFGPSRKLFRSLPCSKGPTTNRPPHLTFLGATPMSIDAISFPSNRSRWNGMHMEGHARTWITRKKAELIYEPYALVHQWGNPGNEPLIFLAFNINPQGVAAVLPGAPANN